MLTPLMLLAVQVPASGFHAAKPRPAPCILKAEFTDKAPPPGLRLYHLHLIGDCAHTEVRVQFMSSLGGIYPTEPLVLNQFHPTVIWPGNPHWWFPVKVTTKGFVRLPITEMP